MENVTAGEESLLRWRRRWVARILPVIAVGAGAGVLRVIVVPTLLEERRGGREEAHWRDAFHESAELEVPDAKEVDYENIE